MPRTAKRAKIASNASSKKSLPEQVKTLGSALAHADRHELKGIAAKLIRNSAECVTMWRALERVSDTYDDFWVWGFLEAASKASRLPPYHYKSAIDRRELAQKILNSAEGLVRALRTNDLDAHLIYNDGLHFNGFFLYEEFSDSNQASIDGNGLEKLKASDFILEIARRAEQKIREEPLSGKIGKNARAIRFVRIMAARSLRLYDQPLNQVTVTATNALFGTAYNEAQIMNLLARNPGARPRKAKPKGGR